MTPSRDTISQLIADLHREETCADSAYKLAKINDERAFKSLNAALGSPKSFVRNFALLALACTRDRRAIEPVTRSLNDPDLGVRSAAAFALGKIGDTQSVPILHSALAAALNEDSHLCRQLLIAIVDLGENESIDSFELALQSNLSEVRRVAVDLFNQVEDKRKYPVLRKALSFESDPSVRKIIEDAIAFNSIQR
jgi:HEAT repeat protein